MFDDVSFDGIEMRDDVRELVILRFQRLNDMLDGESCGLAVQGLYPFASHFLELRHSLLLSTALAYEVTCGPPLRRLPPDGVKRNVATICFTAEANTRIRRHAAPRTEVLSFEVSEVVMVLLRTAARKDHTSVESAAYTLLLSALGPKLARTISLGPDEDDDWGE